MGIRIYKSSGVFYVDINNLCSSELMIWLQQKLVKYAKEGLVYM